jgi:hypothetical protein
MQTMSFTSGETTAESVGPDLYSLHGSHVFGLELNELVVFLLGSLKSRKFSRPELLAQTWLAYLADISEAPAQDLTAWL